MPIKFRILLFVFVLELLGYGVLLAYNARYTEKVLRDATAQQLTDVFNGNSYRINAQTDLIERAAQDLASSGETLFRLKRAQPRQDLDADVESHLVRSLSRIRSVIGAGLWFEPYVYDRGRRLYGPYAYWQDDKVVFTWDLNTEAYDYPDQSWYLTALPKDWDRNRRRPRPLYWTEPYFDQAGTHALMMTADVPMYGPEGAVIGMATVDWSMENMRQFVDQIHVADGSGSFLIDKQSGKFVTFGLDKRLVMQPVSKVAWGEPLIRQAQEGVIGHLPPVRFGQVDYSIYYMATRIGLVFGVLVPVDTVTRQVAPLLHSNFINGSIISACFILIMALALSLLFRPFSRMIRLIGGSMQKDPASGELQLRRLDFREKNEFTRIAHALNEVFAQVQAYTERLAKANSELSAQQAEIRQLNEDLERKVAERTEQLASKNLALQNTIDELTVTQRHLVDAEKHRALSGLVVGIAHEINTPIGVAITAASYVAEETQRLGQQYREGKLHKSDVESYLLASNDSLNVIQHGLDRAAELVESFKRISSDQFAETRRSFNVRQYLDDLLGALHPQLARTRHRVVANCPPDLEVDSYPGAYSQILANLILNSLTHAFPEGSEGEIRVDMRLRGDRLRLEVTDNGVGIPADHLQRIFDPFFTTKRSQEGTGGLGLYVVFNLVSQTLGGHIQVESTAGKGACFIIEAPLTPPGGRSAGGMASTVR